jgi:hypothetical protein
MSVRLRCSTREVTWLHSLAIWPELRAVQQAMAVWLRAALLGVAASQYSTLGENGKCLTLATEEQDGGLDPAHEYHGGEGASCRQLCTERGDCCGYSVSNHNNCLLWLEPVTSGGDTWGGADCIAKSQECCLEGIGCPGMNEQETGDNTTLLVTLGVFVAFSFMCCALQIRTFALRLRASAAMRDGQDGQEGMADWRQPRMDLADSAQPVTAPQTAANRALGPDGIPIGPESATEESQRRFQNEATNATEESQPYARQGSLQSIS